jgi:guanine deaminase
MTAGKVMMDRNAPPALRDTPKASYDASKRLIGRWHEKGRLTYAITPRFAPTSSAEQLDAAGLLWAEHPSCAMQTHLSENRAEIDWVASLFPDAPDYFGVYESFGLTGPGSNFGHAIHLSERERAAFRASGSGVSHCPTSNAFIGSGLFDMAGLRAGADPVTVGLATDVGGGSSFSMLATMRSAYEIAQLRGYSLHPVNAFWLATAGSAELLRQSDRVGALERGLEADIILLDPKATPLLAQRAARADSVSDLLFALMILGDDRAVRRTYSGGRLIHDRDG